MRRKRAVVMLFAQLRDGSVLLERRAERGVWGGLWSPPQLPSAEAARLYAATLPFGLPPTAPGVLLTVDDGAAGHDLGLPTGVGASEVAVTSDGSRVFAATERGVYALAIRKTRAPERP